MRALVIGIGNPLAGDDGVGIRVVNQLQQIISDERIWLVESERAGLDILDLVEGYQKVLIIDAAQTGASPPGTISSFCIRRPFKAGTLPSLHTIGLHTVLAFGTMIGMQLPEEVTVYTVEARDIENVHEGCTTEVEGAIQNLTNMLLLELNRILPDFCPTTLEYTPYAKKQTFGSIDMKQRLLGTTSMESV